MIEPWLVMGDVSTIRFEVVKSSDAAFLIGVGNKDINLDFYIGQGDTGVSCYFKQRGDGDSMKVIFGSTSSGYGKCAQ